MADNTTLNTGAGGDTLRTDDVGSGVKIPVSKIHNGADGVDGGAITPSNPFATQTQSGSLTALLVGGAGATPVSVSNPLPTKTQSGSLVSILLGSGAAPVALGNPLPISGSIGITNGGVNVSRSNPFCIEQSSEASGQMLSGSTVRVVNFANTDVVASGSTQVVAPQGAGNMIRVLSVFAASAGTVIAKWQSTGSAGTIQNLSGYIPLVNSGSFVLPHNPHGWFQTRTNEGLNLALNAAVNVGLHLTWVMA